MKMKSERPLLVDGVPQTEFETNDQHGKELIAKGLAVEFGAVFGDCVNIGGEVGGATGPKSQTVLQLKEALSAKGIEFEHTAKKADLHALLDAAS